MPKTIKSLSPTDGSIVAEIQVATTREIHQKLTTGNVAQIGWNKLPIAERAAFCHKAVDAMLAMSDDIVPELARQMGRPVRYGAGELAGFEERARFMIDIAAEKLADINVGERDGFKRYIRRQPLGLILTIAPWNFPYLTTVNSVIPALMAGNSVMLKHASHTLLVGQRFQQAFDASGMPEGVFQNIVMDHRQTAEVVGGGFVDMLCFTGSVDAGRTMEELAVGHFMAVGLELGGKDPAYVRADCNLEHAIENLADGVFFNTGQSCCGIERIYAHEDVYDDFVAGIVKVANSYVLGDPLDQATTLGPMIKPQAADFVREQINAAVAAGAIPHVDPANFPLSKTGSAFLAPQVLTDVNHTMSVMREESFGPVVGIMKVTNDEEAIYLMNDSNLGLTAAIWTESVEAAETIGDQLETGTVFMNRCDYLDPALAWTGVKNTGRGCTLSALGYESLTRPKSFHLRTKTS